MVVQEEYIAISDVLIAKIVLSYLSSRSLNKTSECFITESKALHNDSPGDKRTLILNHLEDLNVLPCLEDIIKDYFAYTETDEDNSDSLYKLWKNLDVIVNQIRGLTLGKKKNKVFIQSKRTDKSYIRSLHKRNYSKNDQLSTNFQQGNPASFNIDYKQSIVTNTNTTPQAVPHQIPSNFTPSTVKNNDISFINNSQQLQYPIIHDNYTASNISSENAGNFAINSNSEAKVPESTHPVITTVTSKTPVKENVKNVVKGVVKSPKRKPHQPRRRINKNHSMNLPKHELSKTTETPQKAEQSGGTVSPLFKEDFSLILESLFRNSNLHVKLADKINHVATSTESHQAVDQSALCNNNTIIDQVVKLASEDPNFDPLLGFFEDLQQNCVDEQKQSIFSTLTPSDNSLMQMKNIQNANISQDLYESFSYGNLEPNTNNNQLEQFSNSTIVQPNFTQPCTRPMLTPSNIPSTPSLFNKEIINFTKQPLTSTVDKQTSFNKINPHEIQPKSLESCVRNLNAITSSCSTTSGGSTVTTTSTRANNIDFVMPNVVTSHQQISVPEFTSTITPNCMGVNMVSNSNMQTNCNTSGTIAPHRMDVTIVPSSNMQANGKFSIPQNILKISNSSLQADDSFPSPININTPTEISPPIHNFQSPTGNVFTNLLSTSSDVLSTPVFVSDISQNVFNNTTSKVVTLTSQVLATTSQVVTATSQVVTMTPASALRFTNPVTIAQQGYMPTITTTTVSNTKRKNSLDGFSKEVGKTTRTKSLDSFPEVTAVGKTPRKNSLGGFLKEKGNVNETLEIADTLLLLSKSPAKQTYQFVADHLNQFHDNSLNFNILLNSDSQTSTFDSFIHPADIACTESSTVLKSGTDSPRALNSFTEASKLLVSDGSMLSIGCNNIQVQLNEMLSSIHDTSKPCAPKPASTRGCKNSSKSNLKTKKHVKNTGETIKTRPLIFNKDNKKVAVVNTANLTNKVISNSISNLSKKIVVTKDNESNSPASMLNEKLKRVETLDSLKCTEILNPSNASEEAFILIDKIDGKQKQKDNLRSPNRFESPVKDCYKYKIVGNTISPMNKKKAALQPISSFVSHTLHSPARGKIIEPKDNLMILDRLKYQETESKNVISLNHEHVIENENSYSNVVSFCTSSDSDVGASVEINNSVIIEDVFLSPQLDNISKQIVNNKYRNSADSLSKNDVKNKTTKTPVKKSKHKHQLKHSSRKIIKQSPKKISKNEEKFKTKFNFTTPRNRKKSLEGEKYIEEEDVIPIPQPKLTIDDILKDEDENNIRDLLLHSKIISIQSSENYENVQNNKIETFIENNPIPVITNSILKPSLFDSAQSKEFNREPVDINQIERKKKSSVNDISTDKLKNESTATEKSIIGRSKVRKTPTPKLIKSSSKFRKAATEKSVKSPSKTSVVKSIKTHSKLSKTVSGKSIKSASKLTKAIAETSVKSQSKMIIAVAEKSVKSPSKLAKTAAEKTLKSPTKLAKTISKTPTKIHHGKAVRTSHLSTMPNNNIHREISNRNESCDNFWSNENSLNLIQRTLVNEEKSGQAKIIENVSQNQNPVSTEKFSPRESVNLFTNSKKFATVENVPDNLNSGVSKHNSIKIDHKRTIPIFSSSSSLSSSLSNSSFNDHGIKICKVKPYSMAVEIAPTTNDLAAGSAAVRPPTTVTEDRPPAAVDVDRPPTTVAEDSPSAAITINNTPATINLKKRKIDKVGDNKKIEDKHKKKRHRSFNALKSLDVDRFLSRIKKNSP